MAWIPLGGKSRNYKNTETGQILSRRQYDKLTKGINYEQKAKANKKANLEQAVARPARGRTKATTQKEINQRLEAARIQAESKLENAASRNATKKRNSIKRKKITPSLLKTGHFARRIPAKDEDEADEIRLEIKAWKMSNGKRYVSAIGYGMTGFDSRHPEKELDVTLIHMQSPAVEVRPPLDEQRDDYLDEKPYFIWSHYWVHLHFDPAYAQNRINKKNKKNIPKEHRKDK